MKIWAQLGDLCYQLEDVDEPVTANILCKRAEQNELDIATLYLMMPAAMNIPENY